jgi:hypothetical protein
MYVNNLHVENPTTQTFYDLAHTTDCLEFPGMKCILYKSIALTEKTILLLEFCIHINRSLNCERIQ